MQTRTFDDVSYDDLVFTTPLYQKVEIIIDEFREVTIEQEDDDGYAYHVYKTYYPRQFQKLIDFIKDSHNLHGRCPNCKKDTVFKVSGTKLDDSLVDNCLRSYRDEQIDDEYSFIPECEYVMRSRVNLLITYADFFDKIMECLLCGTRYKTAYKIRNGENNNRLFLIKIGQYPSIINFSNVYNASYERFLKKIEALEDMRNAYKMNNDGFNIASYVYYRRVLEKFVYYKFEQESDNISCPINEFKNKRWKEKLETLKEFLPSFLYENQVIYDVLSAGIHMLSEDDCEQYSLIIAGAIESILFQELSDRKRKLTEKQVSNELQNANTSIKMQPRF